jgi:hypothetical protein
MFSLFHTDTGHGATIPKERHRGTDGFLDLVESPDPGQCIAIEFLFLHCRWTIIEAENPADAQLHEPSLHYTHVTAFDDTINRRRSEEFPARLLKRSSSAPFQSSKLLIPKESKCMAASIEKLEKREPLDA